MKKRETVIVYAKRTAIGKLNGGLSSLSAPELGAKLIADAVKTTGIKAETVDELVLGQVLTAGAGQAPARQAGMGGGLPSSVCATTIGKVCGSGMKAVMMGDQMIRAGDAHIVLAGGQESMSNAPHLLPGSRKGYKFGSVEALDSMLHDGLFDPYQKKPMGYLGEMCAKKYQFSRNAQDEFAYESYRKARKAVESGLFAKEIVPVEVVTKKKEGIIVELDEEPFSVDLDRLASLRPAFTQEGSVTAGNASSINDGAALLLLMESEVAAKSGLNPIARIVSQTSFAHDPAWFTTAPIGCIKKLLDKSQTKLQEIDLFEINEAFSLVAMAAIEELELSEEKVNPRGGAVSLGHPIGASGARIIVTLLNSLAEIGGKKGLATLCIGGGEACGLMVEML